MKYLLDHVRRLLTNPETPWFPQANAVAKLREQYYRIRSSIVPSQELADALAPKPDNSYEDLCHGSGGDHAP